MSIAAAPLHLNGLSIWPGQRVLTRLVVSQLPSGTVIDIPVHVLRADAPGPVLLLMGGMHGDEVNGIETIRRMVRRELLQPLCGTIIAVPVFNIYGFLNFSRDVPDGKDVNRSFPGSPRGSLASRVAHRFMREIMPLLDYGIDFHTGGAARANFPQLRCVLGEDAATDALAAAFAAPFTLHAALRPGSLREAAHAQGKRIIVFETGESLRLDEAGIEEGMAGTLRVLHHLGMGPAVAPPARPTVLCRRHRWLRGAVCRRVPGAGRAGRLPGKGPGLRLRGRPLRRTIRAPGIAAEWLRHRAELYAGREPGRRAAAHSRGRVAGWWSDEVSL